MCPLGCAHPEDNVDLVCRHQDEYWNAVSSEQFGEQTAIRIGKGRLKGITLSADLVSEWINAFPITCTVSDRLDGIYPDSEPGSSTQKLHKEEKSTDVHWIPKIGILFLQW